MLIKQKNCIRPDCSRAVSPSHMNKTTVTKTHEKVLPRIDPSILSFAVVSAKSEPTGEGTAAVADKTAPVQRSRSMTTPEDMALDPAWGAPHMIHERDADLIEKGSAITRAVHDLHNPAKRNPSNDIECSEHYTRAMDGYGVFLAACLAAGLPGSLPLWRRLWHLQPETGERLPVSARKGLLIGNCLLLIKQ